MGIAQAVVVDLTKQRFQIPVVRVILPGLEGVYKDERSDYSPGPRARQVMGKGTMTVCIFLGPTLPVADARRLLEADYLPPVRQGDVHARARPLQA